MHPIFILLALLILFGAHLARLPARGGVWLASGAFVAGLVAMALLLRVVFGGLGIGRTTDFDRVVNAAVAAASQDDAPLIIFTGASYSRNALDDETLTQALRARGFPHRAINLSLEAASMLERQAHLEAFIDRSGRIPDVVFIEVARDFDMRVAQFFDNSKFSARGIEQFGPVETVWTLRGLTNGACPGAAGCVKDTAFLGLHFALNAANVGLGARGEPAGQAGDLASYDPQDTPREEIDLLDRGLALTAAPDVSPVTGPPWARDFRQAWRAHLTRQGVGRTGYYFPPVIEANKRAYAEGLCRGELSDPVCIAPQDEALLDALDDDVWFDRSHLLDPGAQLYSSWLAGKIAESGILAGPEAASGPGGGAE